MNNTRSLASLCLVAALAFTGCDRVKNIKVPFFSKKTAEQTEASSGAPWPEPRLPRLSRRSTRG
jgi:hypothetical protein